jgi:hypothetical protein
VDATARSLVALMARRAVTASMIATIRVHSA